MSERILHRAEIIAVGTELLIGDIVNTNAAYLARRLSAIGIGVYRQSVVGDNPMRLREDLENAFDRVDLVITTGGLGPTADDLTKETAAALFGQEMYLHQPSLDRIEAYFASMGKPMTENNRKQAMIPRDAVIFENHNGTAPALAMVRDDGKVLVMLPGPPRELEPLFEKAVVPFLLSRTDAVLYSRNLHIVGMGESAVASALGELLDSENPTVAPYCAPSETRLRVTARAANQKEAAALCDGAVAKILASPVAPFVYGIDVPDAETALVSLLAEKKMTISTAESCTGGLIAKRLTDVPGASDVTAGGAVTYQTREKVRLLGIPEELIEHYGVVSKEVACAMADAARARFDTDLSLATTGFAGPGGGTEKEPVGTVYIALSHKGGTLCRRLSLSPLRDRDFIRVSAATYAMVEALRFLRQNSDKP